MTTTPAVPSFEQFYISQERDRLNSELETATMIGDASKVKAIATKLVDLEKRSGGAAPPAPGAAGAGKPGEGGGAVQQQQGAGGATWTVDQARAAIEKQADWFGSDPEMTKAAFEIANFINTRKYKTPEEYAKAIQEAVEKKFDVELAAGGDEDEETAAEGDGEADAGEGESTEDETPRRKPARRATPSPGGGGASRVSGAGDSRIPTKFSQIPDATLRKKLQAMAARQKLDEKVVVRNWYDLEQKKRKSAKTGGR